MTHRFMASAVKGQVHSDFPLGKSTGKPAGWYWIKNRKPPPLLGMDVETALTYQLLERFVAPLLPTALWERLRPQFAQARERLRAHSSARFAQWSRRVAVDHGIPPLLAPKVDPKVLRAVTGALLESLRLEFDYRKPTAEGVKPTRRHRVEPYGLVMRDRALYLIAAPSNSQQADVGPLNFALHRMSEAEILSDHASVSSTFDLERDVARAGALGILRGGTIRVELRVSGWCAAFLSESRLATDQRITPIRGRDHYRVTATVPNTDQLRWWLLSLGKNVEVLKPASLRRDIAKETTAVAQSYRDRQPRTRRSRRPCD